MTLQLRTRTPSLALLAEAPGWSAHLLEVAARRAGLPVTTDPAEPADALVAHVDSPTALHRLVGRREALGRPRTLVIAEPGLDDDVRAAGVADEVLVAPVGASILVDRVVALAGGRPATGAAVLAVTADVDELVATAGGTLAHHRGRGDRVVVLVVGDEPTAAHLDALRLLGAEVRHRGAEPAGTALADTLDELRPGQVLVPSPLAGADPATLVGEVLVAAAARSVAVLAAEGVTPSVDFRPDAFTTVDRHLDTKRSALAAVALDERPEVLAARTDLVMATGRFWSRFARGRVVEPFETLREAGRPTLRLVGAGSGVERAAAA